MLNRFQRTRRRLSWILFRGSLGLYHSLYGSELTNRRFAFCPRTWVDQVKLQGSQKSTRDRNTLQKFNPSLPREWRINEIFYFEEAMMKEGVLVPQETFYFELNQSRDISWNLRYPCSENEVYKFLYVITWLKKLWPVSMYGWDGTTQRWEWAKT